MSEDTTSTANSAEIEAHVLAEDLLSTVEGAKRLSLSSPAIFLADVKSDVEQFGAQLRFCRKRNLLFPCYTIEGRDPIPIDFGTRLGPYRRALTKLPDFVLEGFYHPNKFASARIPFSQESHVGFAVFEPEEVRSFFKNRLVRFLATRFKWGLPLGAGVLGPPGFPFEVVTSSSGLRVHYSRVFLFNPNAVFGSRRTSPVDGYLNSGNYMFGVSGPSITGGPQFSTAEFEIPQVSRAELWEF
jgi:hypothetical protein